MPLLCVGVSHLEAAPHQLAALSSETDSLNAYIMEHGADQIDGLVWLATCNRFEAYLDANTFHGAVGLMMQAVKAVLPTLPETLTDAFRTHVGPGAVEHLFMVTAGMESMVIGEAEIAGQVRSALAASRHVSHHLRRAFQGALTTSKAITSRTKLRAVGRSLASVGLDLAAPPSWPDSDVLVLGTGEYAGTVVAELLRRHCHQITVFSGSGNAENFAASHPVTPAASLPEALAQADLLVTASGNGTAKITAAMVEQSSITGIVDLTGGADLDDHLPTRVIGLSEIGQHAPPANNAAIEQAKQLIAEGVAAALIDELEHGAAPAITAMRGYVGDIIAAEAARARAAYPPETAAAVEKALHRVTGALLHHPSVAAAELARIGRMAEYNQALETLFGILVETP